MWFNCKVILQKDSNDVAYLQLEVQERERCDFKTVPYHAWELLHNGSCNVKAF